MANGWLLYYLLLVYVGYGGDSPDWTSPTIGIVMSVVLLTIDYRLWTESGLNYRTEPTLAQVGKGETITDSEENSIIVIGEEHFRIGDRPRPNLFFV